MHGHIKWLLNKGITNIFYPCMTYNVDEKGTENCYNCPVVAYYPEVLHANMHELNNVNFMFSYLGLLHKKNLVKKLLEMFQAHYPDITKDELKKLLIKPLLPITLMKMRLKPAVSKLLLKPVQNIVLSLF